MRTEDMYYNEQKRSEVMEAARRLRRKFLRYQQAMEYYGLGYKPIVRLSHISGSVYKIGKKVLIRRSIFEEYLRNHVKRGTEEWEELLR